MRAMNRSASLRRHRPDRVLRSRLPPERSWEVNAEGAARTLQTNLGSVYTGLSTVLPAMLRGSGGIAIVASVAGYFGLPNASVYGPSKAALINLAELLYVDLRPRGLSVYLINPGFVQTSLTAKNDTMPALQRRRRQRARSSRGLASGRFEDPLPAPLYAGAETVTLAALPPALPADFTTGTSMTQLDALLDWYATMTPANHHPRRPAVRRRRPLPRSVQQRARRGRHRNHHAPHVCAHRQPHFIIGERIAQGGQAFATWTFVCTLRGRCTRLQRVAFPL
jgi:hypothetical protein